MIKIGKTAEDEKVKITVKSLYEGHHRVTYKGIKAIRCPFDYLMYQMILWEVKPDLIIEIGANKGGGALYLADLLETIGNGEIHSIDVVDIVEPVVKENKRIKFFFEGWENYDLKLAEGYEKIVIIEDASHKYKDSIGILNKFSHLVSVGSYFIVEDGIVNELGMEKVFEGGPLKAIREFLPKHPEYQVDKKWCNMFGMNATFNVNGYLKRMY